MRATGVEALGSERGVRVDRREAARTDHAPVAALRIGELGAIEELHAVRIHETLRDELLVLRGLEPSLEEIASARDRGGGRGLQQRDVLLEHARLIRPRELRDEARHEDAIALERGADRF